MVQFFYSLFPLAEKIYVKEKYLYGIITCALGLNCDRAAVVVSAIKQQLDMTGRGNRVSFNIHLYYIFKSVYSDQRD